MQSEDFLILLLPTDGPNPSNHAISYCLLTIHKTYNIYKGEEGLIKTIDTPPTIKMHTLKASLKMIN